MFCSVTDLSDPDDHPTCGNCGLDLRRGQCDNCWPPEHNDCGEELLEIGAWADPMAFMKRQAD